MELQGEDGCVVELSETLKKELGRGPGIAPHDRSVSRRQVRLQVQQISSHSVVIEVIGPNPICVLHASVGDLEVEIVKPGTQSSLKIGDKFSLSIQEPVFYTLRRPQLSGQESTDRGKPLKDEEQGVDEEKGIAEAVARWQRRKQERLQSDQRRPLAVEDDAQQAQDVSQQELVYNQAISQEANEPELIERPTTNEDYADVAKKFGFIVEGSEFERYGKKGLDTSKWDWRIGRQPGSDDDDDEEEGSGRLQQNRTAPGPSTKRKAKPRSEDDDDDWRGDSDGEKELLAARKIPVPRKKDVQTRSQNLATSSETILDPRKKRKMVSTSDMGHPSIEEKDSKVSKQRTASTSTKKTTKRRPRASESEEEEDDDDGEDLDGFLVDDAEGEDEEVADEEDEWTDEDDEIEDDDELEENPARAHAPGRPVMDKRNGDDDKPLCKYGNKCFRKNKDHLAQFRH